jgi:DNA-binding IscR family transcriptional regulator
MARSARTTTNPVITDTPHPRPSKIDAVLDLLRRSEGATLGEITEATGWQPHSARAVLTGLRRKGHVLEKTKRGDVTCYRIAEPA